MFLAPCFEAIRGWPRPILVGKSFMQPDVYCLSLLRDIPSRRLFMFPPCRCSLHPIFVHPVLYTPFSTPHSLHPVHPFSTPRSLHLVLFAQFSFYTPIITVHPNIYTLFLQSLFHPLSPSFTPSFDSCSDPSIQVARLNATIITMPSNSSPSKTALPCREHDQFACHVTFY